ncbi:MAG: TonB-dependent receptor plug domain-containing protein, partial [Bacteroidota bacterium]
MRKVFVFIMLGMLGNVQAQITALDTVVISAQQIDQKAYETGRSVDVISAKQIAEMPVQSIDELLRYVSGVNINSRNGFGVQADLGMRGSTFTQVLVLVDNVRLNDPLTGHFNHNFPVALSDIAQIEIVKGPAAVSYGADAVGGMIHIKTKSYVQDNNKEEIDATIDFGYGDHSLINTDAGIYFSKDKLTLSGSYRLLDSDGETLRNPNFDAGIAESETYDNFFSLSTASFSAAYRFSDKLRAHARFSNDQRDFKAQYFYTASAFDESREETSNNWGTLAIISEREKGNSELNLGYRVSTDFFEFNPLFTPNEHEMTQQFANFKNSFELGQRSTFVLGLQYVNKEVESTDRGNHENTSLAAYGILTHSFDNGLFANASLRAENDDNFGTEVLPQVSLSYI